MKYKIIIATKGRAGASKTIDILLGEKITPILIVEPQDRKSYYDAYPDAEIVTMPENDQGITYARNFCLGLARERNYPWFWMMDDDISSMGVVRKSKVVKEKFGTIMAAAEKHITQFGDVALGSLEYQQYAWSAKKPYVFNSYCDCVVLISTERTKHMGYSPDVKEDRDFVLQALSTGYRSMRTCLLAFGAPKNGSNKGGLHEDYASGKEVKWSENMIKKWPGICEMNIKKDGRPDVKINWRAFRPDNS